MTDHAGEAVLSVTVDGREVLRGTLAEFILRGSLADEPGRILPFVYRLPVDPEQPDLPRPLTQGEVVVRPVAVLE